MSSFWQYFDSQMAIFRRVNYTHTDQTHTECSVQLSPPDSDADLSVIQELEVVPRLVVTHLPEVDSVHRQDLVLHLQLTALLGRTT